MALMLLLPLLGSNVSAKEIGDQEIIISRMRTTAYCTGTTSAVGEPIRHGIVGVPRKYLGKDWCCAVWLEDGTFLGYYDCWDTGADPEQTLIDFYYPTYDECVEHMKTTGGYVIVQFIKAYG